MFPYLILLAFLFFLSGFDRTKLEKLFFAVLLLWLLIFSAFRVGGTGAGDYENYILLYSRIQDWNSVINPDVHTEIGFRILAWLGNIIGLDSQFIIASMAFLSLSVVGCVIYKHSPLRIFSLVCWMPYFLSMNMHSSRISVAAAFGLLFLICFHCRKYFESFILFVVAVSFHSSALILLLVFFTRLTIGSLVLILFCSLILLNFINPVYMLGLLFSSFGMERYASFINIYLASAEYGYPLKLYDPRIVLALGVVLLIVNIRKTIVAGNDESLFLFLCKLYIVGVIVMTIFSSVTIMAWRASYYFLIAGVVVIPFVAGKYDQRFLSACSVNRIMSLIFLVLYSVFSLGVINASEPYTFIWSSGAL